MKIHSTLFARGATLGRGAALSAGIALSAGLTLAVLSAAPASADTKSPAMQACSDKWSQMKADNSVPAGTTWPKFWSQCSKDYAAAHPSDAAAKAAATAPAPATEPAAATTTPAPTKAAKTTKAAKADATEDDVAVPADAEAAAKLDDSKAKVGADGTKPKRELTPGQQAAVKRIKACGAEWQQEKAAGKLPAGAKWPQYWSDCNKRLKAKGQ